MDLGLGGKAAFITGASRGIGLAIARRLVEEGCAVAICARGEGGLRRAETALREAGGTVHAAPIDVTAPSELERFVDEAAARLGRLDLLVANAGGASGGRDPLATSPNDWHATYALNTVHAVRLIRAGLPHQRRSGGGAAVIIASISGWKPATPLQYGAAKAAEIYLPAALVWRLAPDSVRVNVVSPGSILFPGGGWDDLRRTEPDRFAAFLRNHHPAGRLGTPDEVADVVAFLLSDRARWINGAHVAVDGGQGAPST